MTEQEPDIRWKQRYSNFRKALRKLDTGVRILGMGAAGKDDENVQLQKEGLIQRFEYTHELAWNVMKDYAEYQGNFEIKGSRDATREAFRMKLIAQADIWMDMIKSRNDTFHTYNEEMADAIVSKITQEYGRLFHDFENVMEGLRSGQ
jgi:nucleotidyltransferase substrate binding protein (TIGR01987 family)